MSEWVFHFRNIDETDTWFSVQHAGCGGTPYYNGRPKCWAKTIPHNPFGGHHSVYNPSNWVIGFGSWWNIIKDGLNLIKDTAAFIASEGENEQALNQALKDTFKLEMDIIKGVTDDYFATHTDLASMVTQSRKEAALAAATTPERIINLAEQLGLGRSGWVFVAGNPYMNLVHESNRMNDHHGWTLLANPHNHLKGIGNTMANHTFISGGQLHFAWSSSAWGPDSKHEHARILSQQRMSIRNGEEPNTNLMELWVNY